MATISLSFDNGPTVGVTDRVLDILRRHEVTANFFVIGSKVRDSDTRALVERARAEGHVVGGHTWTHSVPFGRLDDEGVDRELDQTTRLLRELGAEALRFRPYGVGGVIDDRLMSAHGADRLCAGSYTCVLWNSVPRDWVDAQGWVDVALADIATRDWSVLVLHDLPLGAVDRLDEFLARVKEAEFRFELDTPDECTPIRRGTPTSSYELLGVGPATTR